MKIVDYSKVTSVSSSDLFILNGSAGTKTILASNLANALPGLLTSEDALFAMLDATAPPETHGEIYRGKNIGSSLTSAQIANIENGTFKGLWLGDYWLANGTKWVIVDFDYWIYNGHQIKWNKHHLAIMPSSVLYNAKMNDTRDTEGGYIGSKMNATNLEDAKNKAKTAFGSSVLTHVFWGTNASSSNSSVNGASGTTTFVSDLILPNEVMVFGSLSCASPSNVCNIPSPFKQLSIFKTNPGFVNGLNEFWLSDISDYYKFSIATDGHPSSSYADNSVGVLPVFAIGKP